MRRAGTQEKDGVGARGEGEGTVYGMSQSGGQEARI